MNIKTKILTVFLTAFAAAALFPAVSDAAPLSLAPELVLDDDQKVQRLLSDGIENKLKRGAFFLLGIESKLSDSREELKMLKKNIRALKNKIGESEVKMDDLQSQIDNLDKLIAENQMKVRAGELLAAELENEIILAQTDIDEKEAEIDRQAKSLDSALNAYYLQNNTFFGGSASSQPSLLAFLSADESAGEILKQNEYLFALQNASALMVKQMEEGQIMLENEREELKFKKEKLSQLRAMLSQERRSLYASQESKKRLLEETKGQQLIYETLLELSKKEEEQVSVSIERLKENYAFFQEKLDTMKADPRMFETSAGDGENSSVSEENLLGEYSAAMLKGETPLAWPVNPALGISAFFRDSEYQKTIGIPHNAIDIRIVQGSKVKAPADGVVTKVADNGFAYSYVIIGHPDNVLTLYGHLSDIFVKEGEIVRQGQVIGLSGGIPGTKGAGWLTTGAHLHFEVFKNFRHADPLEYLPLEYLPLSSLPAKYLDKITGETGRPKVPREKAAGEKMQ